MKDKMEDKELLELVKSMLKGIGDNIDRPGLEGTPERIVRMWQEIYRGYDESQRPNITTFENDCFNQNYTESAYENSIVSDSGDFYSMCEHHMMPFFGKYYFAYIPHPEGRILGLSKVARVVDYCSAKLQIQERLVNEIVDMLWDALCVDPKTGRDIPAPIAMGLVLDGEHLCKSMRGARKKGNMRSIALRGLFLEGEKREEFIKLALKSL